MVEPVKKSPDKYNQALLQSELDAALVIRNQFYALTQDMYHYHPDPVVKTLQEKVEKAATEALENMLQADSKEAFEAHKKRFDRLFGEVKVLLQLQAASEEELQTYHVCIQMRKLLKDTNPKNIRNKIDELRENSVKFARLKKSFSVYAPWKTKLDLLCSLAQNPVAFTQYKKDMQADLMALASENNLANSVSVALIERNISSLALIRLSYLKAKNNRSELGASLSWIAAGLLIGTAGAVIGFVFPALFIPALLLGAAALGHGLTDFIKESVLLGAKITDIPELGERKLSEKTKLKVEDFEEKIEKAGSRKLLNGPLFKPKVWSTKDKWWQGFNYAMVFLTLGIAAAGFITLLPGLGIPLAMAIALTTVSAVVTVCALSLYGYQLFQDHKEIDVLKEATDSQISADKQLFPNTINHLYREDALSSDGKILRAFRERKEVHEAAQKLDPIPSSEKIDEKIHLGLFAPKLHKELVETLSYPASPSAMEHP